MNLLAEIDWNAAIESVVCGVIAIVVVIAAAFGKE